MCARVCVCECVVWVCVLEMTKKKYSRDDLNHLRVCVRRRQMCMCVCVYVVWVCVLATTKKKYSRDD